MILWLWTMLAVAAPSGWRWDGTNTTTVAAPALLGAPAWSTALPATGNASVIAVGPRVCGLAEPVTLWCADAASGRMLWTRTNGWVDTLSAAARPAGDARLAAGEAALKDLAAAQADYSALRRQARSAPDDTTIFDRLQAVSARMEQLKAASADVEPLRTPPSRGQMGWSSATPVTDGSAIYAVFSNGVVSRFDGLGNRVWSVWLGPSKQEMRGYLEGTTASPVLVDDILVVPYGKLLGLDTATGAVRWTGATWTDYGSPAVARLGGAVSLLTPNGHVVDPRTGRELQSSLGDIWYSSPVVHGDMAFWIGGRDDAHVQAAASVMARAVKLTASGGVVRADPAWSVPVAIAERFYAAPVVKDDVVYTVSRSRTLVALRRSTGEQLYMYSLSNLIRGESWSNPFIAGSVLYVPTDLGEVLAIKAGPTYETIGVSTVGPMLATPVVANGRLVFRTYKSLVAYGG